MKRLVSLAALVMLAGTSVMAAPKKGQGLPNPYGPNINNKYGPTQRTSGGPTRQMYYRPTGPVAGGASREKPARLRDISVPRKQRYPDRFLDNGQATAPLGSDYGNNPFQSNGNSAPTLPNSPLRPSMPFPTDDAGDMAPEEEVQNELLADALEEITKAWKAGDGKTLQARFGEDRNVGLFPYGKFNGELPALELGRQIAEGAPALKTTVFKFNAPRTKTELLKFVTGTHVYTDAAQQQQTAYVSYMLERIKGRWMIVEYGWSDRPLSNHSRPLTKGAGTTPAQ